MTQPTFGTVGFYQAMADALNADPEWAEKGADLDFAMIYVYGEPIDKVFYVEFSQGGQVSDAEELASQEDRDADFVISGPAAVWKDVLSKAVKPTTALATGKLKVKGKQTQLLKNMSSFTHILDVMGGLDPIYPDNV